MRAQSSIRGWPCRPDRRAVDEQGELFLEGERGDIGLLALPHERLGHAVELERYEVLLGWISQHRWSFSLCQLFLGKPPVRASAVRRCRVMGRLARELVSDGVVPGAQVGLVEIILQDRSDQAVRGDADIVTSTRTGL